MKFTLYNDIDISTDDIKNYYDMSKDDIPTDNDIDYFYQDIFEELKVNLEEFNKQSNKFLMTGTCGLWYGRQQGGKVLEDLKDCIDSLYDYTEIEYDNGIINIKTIHHDGTNYYQIQPLSTRGEKYFDRHYYEMSDRELHEKLQNVKGMLKKFKY